MKKPSTSAVTLYPQDYNNSAKSYTCANICKIILRWTLLFLIVATLATLVALAIVFWNGTDNIIALQRLYVSSIDCDGNNGASVTGMIQFNLNSRISPVSWYILPFNLSTIINIGIYGPMQENNQNGPLVFPLCGSPSSLVCTLNGTISQGEPGGFPLQDLIAGIRAFNYAYYYNISTTLYPSMSCRGTLGISSGKP
jgi:hypothetical protein